MAQNGKLFEDADGGLLWAAIPDRYLTQWLVKAYLPDTWYDTPEEAKLEANRHEGWTIVGRNRKDVVLP